MKLQKRISIITGHYGCGKTNIAVNLALREAAAKVPVTLVDLDIVNPYYRTADFKVSLERAGVRLIAPVYANTNLDSPVLPPEISGIFRPDAGTVILDVGGDDAGAIALGQYASRIAQTAYDFFYVINAKRYLTRTPEEAAKLLCEIEAASRLKATALINNTNLGADTTRALIDESAAYAEAVSALTGLPLAFTCVPESLFDENESPKILPVEILVKQSWTD